VVSGKHTTGWSTSPLWATEYCGAVDVSRNIGDGFILIVSSSSVGTAKELMWLVWVYRVRVCVFCCCLGGGISFIGPLAAVLHVISLSETPARFHPIITTRSLLERPVLGSHPALITRGDYQFWFVVLCRPCYPGRWGHLMKVITRRSPCSGWSLDWPTAWTVI